MMILHIEVYPALYRADVYIGLPLLEAAKVVHEFMFER